MENLLNQNHLTEEELAEPTLVLKKLLTDTASSEHLRIELWEWVKSVLYPEPWSFLQSPDKVLFLHEDFSRLLTALHLLLKECDVSDELPVSNADEERMVLLDREYENQKNYYQTFYQFRGHIRRLGTDEVADPYIAIKACFEFHDLDEWKEVLKSWTGYSLSNISIAEEGPEIQLLREYEYLDKMVEVSYLLIKEQDRFHERHHQTYWSSMQSALVASSTGERTVSIKLLKEFLQFIDTVPPVRLNKNLRNIFIDYLTFNIGGHVLDFEDYLFDLQRLHHFLDIADKETRNWKREEGNDGK